MKPMLTGFVDISGQVPPAFASVVKNVTVEVGWAEIEPQHGVYDFSAIDRALTAAGTARVLLRVFAGIHSPDWVKNLAGGPVGVVVGDKPATVPRWWTDEVYWAWNGLNNHLGPRYDRNPQVGEITCSMSMTVFAEPFMRVGVTPTIQAKGYTQQLDLASYTRGVEAMLQGWPNTHISIAVNPYQSQFGTGGADVTIGVLNKMIGEFGPHLLVCNNSLRSPINRLGPEYGKIYGWMQAIQEMKRQPIGIQTAMLSVIGNTLDTVQEAANLKAARVELPGGYQGSVTPVQLQLLLPKLLANAVS